MTEAVMAAKSVLLWAVVLAFGFGYMIGRIPVGRDSCAGRILSVVDEAALILTASFVLVGAYLVFVAP